MLMPSANPSMPVRMETCFCLSGIPALRMFSIIESLSIEKMKPVSNGCYLLMGGFRRFLITF